MKGLASAGRSTSGSAIGVHEVLALADEARQLASLSPEMRQWMKHMEEARQAQVHKICFLRSSLQKTVVCTGCPK